MNFLNRNFFIIIGIIVLAATAYYFSDIVTYILIAWVLSMLGNPLVVFFQKRIRLGRLIMGNSTAALLTILVFYTALACIILLFVPTIVAQARNIANIDYQALGEKLRDPFFKLDAQMHEIGMLDPGQSLATKTQEILSNWFKPTLLGDFLGAFRQEFPRSVRVHDQLDRKHDLKNGGFLAHRNNRESRNETKVRNSWNIGTDC